MAYFGASNQLIQIDTGKARTYLFNKSLSPISVYANINEVQVTGQRFVAVDNTSASTPYGTPAIYMLVNYLSTSALVTANLTTAGAPAPVYWTDNTFSTVTAITTEAFATTPIAFPAGYLMVNTVSLPTLTAAQVIGAQLLIQVAGYLKGAYAPAQGTVGIGSTIVGFAGTFQSNGVAAGTAATYKPFGRQLTAIASGLCDVLVDADNF